MSTFEIQEESPKGHIPLYVQIELTWRCNWRCVHCYQDRHDLQILTTDQVKALIKELHDNGTMHIVITGGEPLLRKDIFEILEYIRSNDIIITLYSNGQVI